MPENKESTKQLLDISRNMKDIMSQVKNISADVKKGNEINDKNKNLIKNFEKNSKSPATNILNSIKQASIKQKPEEASPSKKAGKLDAGKVKDILAGQIPLKGALKLGGEIEDPGNYIVGENGPEVVNVPKGSSVIPLDVSDLVEGLNNVSQIKKSIVDNKVNVNTSDKTIKTENGDFSIDALVKSYSATLAEDSAMGLDNKESAMALTSLQKLSEKISSVPQEQQAPAAKSEKKAEPASQSKTAEQKLISKTKGPTSAEIEAEKKRLIQEDPDFYKDPKNLQEEIDYFVSSYDFNAESVKKINTPAEKNSELGNINKKDGEDQKAKSVEESAKLIEKSKPLSSESLPGETIEKKLKGNKNEEKPNEEGKKSLVEKKDNLIEKIKGRSKEDQDKLGLQGDKEKSKTEQEKKEEEKKSKFDLIKGLKKSKEEKGEKSEDTPKKDSGEITSTKIDVNQPTLIGKEKPQSPEISENKKESTADFSKIAKGINSGDKKAETDAGGIKGKPESKESSYGEKIRSSISTQLQDMYKKEKPLSALPSADKAKEGLFGKTGSEIFNKGKDKVSKGISAFKETIGGKLADKIPSPKVGSSPLSAVTDKLKPASVTEKPNLLKKSGLPDAGIKIPGLKNKDDNQGAKAGGEGIKAKMEKSVSALSQKSPEIKKDEPAKSEVKPKIEAAKPIAPTPEPKTSKSEEAPKKEKEKSAAPSSDSGGQSMSGLEDLKGLLSQIAISLSSPVTFYNPDPFRPDSRRI
jgi:hypothetical protein